MNIIRMSILHMSSHHFRLRITALQHFNKRIQLKLDYLVKHENVAVVDNQVRSQK